jgi:hypothetical protein
MRLKFVIACGHAAKLLQAAEKTFDRVALARAQDTTDQSRAPIGGYVQLTGQAAATSP